MLNENRSVGAESLKTYKDKFNNGFFHRYMNGHGIEIGWNSPDTILPHCDGVGLNTPGYDGIHIPCSDNHYDYLYSSHCLEHIADDEAAIQEWFRVIKHCAHMVIVVPHQWLYEKKEALPSRFSSEHIHFYTSATLLSCLDRALPPRSYRIRHLHENDEAYDYSLPDDMHSIGQYEIEVVIQKL